MQNNSFSDVDMPSLAPNAAHFPYTQAIRFTGSGSEYFRIWIVNLLLTVITLSLYLPWAKVRRLKYFHGNTLLGDEPLGYHANPRKMLRGYLLVGLLFVLYSVAGHFSPVAGLIALLIVVAVSPVLFRASLQFRMANTSWRGLRLRFTGSLGQAYMLVVPALVTVVFGFGLAMLGAREQQQQPPSNWLLLLMIPALLLQFGVGAWWLWRTKKYQHDHYALGTLQTQFTARLRQFAGLLLRCVGVALLLVVVPIGLVIAAAASGWVPTLDKRLQPLLIGMTPFLVMLVIFAVLKPYFTTRLQNLTWNHTGNSALQFHSNLRFRSMLALTLKNWLLIVLTLGLYWPFAAVAMARMRLQTVSLSTQDAPETLANSLRATHNEAAGDAAADLFGLDVGL
jgi:uncharacterized membrane protein YjgN (DUF898 family)